MEDLEVIRDELSAKILGIDTQLAQRGAQFKALELELRRSGDFERLQKEAREYHTWRGSALHARTHAISEVQEIRREIKAANKVASESLNRRRYSELRKAVIAHRQKVYDAGYTATAADNELWDVVDEYDAEDQRNG